MNCRLSFSSFRAKTDERFSGFYSTYVRAYNVLRRNDAFHHDENKNTRCSAAPLSFQ